MINAADAKKQVEAKIQEEAKLKLAEKELEKQIIADWIKNNASTEAKNQLEIIELKIKDAIEKKATNIGFYLYYYDERQSAVAKIISDILKDNGYTVDYKVKCCPTRYDDESREVDVWTIDFEISWSNLPRW